MSIYSMVGCIMTGIRVAAAFLVKSRIKSNGGRAEAGYCEMLLTAEAVVKTKGSLQRLWRKVQITTRSCFGIPARNCSCVITCCLELSFNKLAYSEHGDAVLHRSKVCHCI